MTGPIVHAMCRVLSKPRATPDGAPAWPGGNLIKWSIARRYARALFEALGTEHERASAELAATSRALEAAPELAVVLEDPRLTREERLALIEKIVGALDLLPAVANLLRLLGDRNRIDQLPGIAQVFGGLVDAQVGRVRGEIFSAAPIGRELVERLESVLADATGKKVILQSAENPQILGGLVARIGNVVYDGSLRTQLETLRRELGSRA